MKMYKFVAGVDEVGRGPLVGDVVTAAVILNPQMPIHGLKDSKKLTANRREELAQEIKQHAIAWAIGRASPEEIDTINILHATMLAMVRAIDALHVCPDFIRVDGNRLPAWNYASEAVVKGDALHAEISAASIIAKVARDNDMIELDKVYPQYGFAGHKGYPTQAHVHALNLHGVLPCYRKTFRPVQALIAEQPFEE